MDNMCSCIQKFDELHDFVNQNHNGYSYPRLRELKSLNLLDKMIEDRKINEDFYQELISFFNILFTRTLDDIPFVKKILLHESNLVFIFRKYGYEMSLYMNDLSAHRFFPIFIKDCIDSFNINELKNYSYEMIEKILKENMDINYYYDPNYERDLAELVQKYTNSYTDYRKYDDKIKNNKLNINDQTELFIWAENEAYNREYMNIKQYNMYNADYIVRWVSKNHGDGYGFDVLSYDPINKKQKLIEVKSSRVGKFILTGQEFRVLNSIKKRNDVDYYIYEYYKDINNNIQLSQLKYDKEKNIFVDIITGEIHYISPYFWFDEDKIQRVSAAVEPEKVYKKCK